MSFASKIRGMSVLKVLQKQRNFSQERGWGMSLSDVGPWVGRYWQLFQRHWEKHSNINIHISLSSNQKRHWTTRRTFGTQTQTKKKHKNFEANGRTPTKSVRVSPLQALAVCCFFQVFYAQLSYKYAKVNSINIHNILIICPYHPLSYFLSSCQIFCLMLLKHDKSSRIIPLSICDVS